MEKITLNDELTLVPPAGFRRMTEAECSGMTVLEDGLWVGLRDEERRIVVTAGWKDVDGLTAILLKSRDLAKNMEKQVQKAMESMDYHLVDFADRTIAGMRASGFQYKYRAQETDMMGESYAVKRGRTVYYFHFYARSTLRQGHLIWEEMLDAVNVE